MKTKLRAGLAIMLIMSALAVGSTPTVLAARQGPMSSADGQMVVHTKYVLSAHLGVPAGALSAADTGRLALSTDGTMVLVGAPYRNVGEAENAGAADVFQHDGRRWGEPTELSLGPKAKTQDNLGAAAALSGDGNTALLVAVRQLRQIAEVFSNRGGKWVRPAALNLRPQAGWPPWPVDSVALNGNGRTALVGMGSQTVGRVVGAGVAEVFRLRGTHWTGPTILGRPDSGCMNFGYSVALDADADTALVGSPFCGDGAAEIFQFEHGKWVASGKLTGPASAVHEYGVTVALGGDGHVALLGSDSLNGAEAFTLSGASWSRPFVLHPVRPSDTSCGLSIGLSGSGLTAILGVSCDDGGPVATIYQLNRTGWSETGRLPTSSNAGGFGHEVALNGDGSTAAVLAWTCTPIAGCGDDGVVEVFRRVGT